MIHRIFYLLSLTLLYSCNNNSNFNHLSFKDVEYIDDFPTSISIHDGEQVNLDYIGMTDFRIIDTLLIASSGRHDTFWTLFSTKNLDKIGSFISKGQGPNELIFPPSLDSKTSFTYEDDTLFSCIYDFQTGKYYDLNLTESINTQKTSIRQTKDSLPPFLFDLAKLNDTCFYCKETVDGGTRQSRFLLTSKGKNVIDKFINPNNTKVSDGENTNILSTISVKHPTKDVIAEGCIGLNQINLFSISGSLNKTICAGKELDGINEIQNKKPWERLYTYGGMRAYDNYFAALYVGVDGKTYQVGPKDSSQIQFFTWDGEALGKILLDSFITHFDIDFKNGFLYTLNCQDDEFLRYKIDVFLGNIQK